MPEPEPDVELLLLVVVTAAVVVDGEDDAAEDVLLLDVVVDAGVDVGTLLVLATDVVVAVAPGMHW